MVCFLSNRPSNAILNMLKCFYNNSRFLIKVSFLTICFAFKRTVPLITVQGRTYSWRQFFFISSINIIGFPFLMFEFELWKSFCIEKLYLHQIKMHDIQTTWNKSTKILWNPDINLEILNCWVIRWWVT